MRSPKLLRVAESKLKSLGAKIADTCCHWLEDLKRTFRSCFIVFQFLGFHTQHLFTQERDASGQTILARAADNESIALLLEALAALLFPLFQAVYTRPHWIYNQFMNVFLRLTATLAKDWTLPDCINIRRKLHYKKVIPYHGLLNCRFLRMCFILCFFPNA